MGRLVQGLGPKKYAVMQRHTQAGNIDMHLKVEVDFTLSELRDMDVVMWKCHVNDSAKGIKKKILGRYLLT